MKTNIIKIAAIGYSITYGFPYGPALSWFSIAAEKNNLKYVNRGINGDTTEGMLCRFDHDILRSKPTHVIIMGGTNDAYAGINAEQVINNIRDMVELAFKNNIISFIGLPVPCNDLAEEKLLGQYRKEMREYAEDHNIEVIDFHKALVDDSGFKIKEGLHCDGIHPSAAGYKVMADVAAKFLEDKS
jgi:acyl-CoA thioesterase-1